MSLDAKATVKIGEFSRGGKSRIPVAAADHDFSPEATITPVGVLIPELDELYIGMVDTKVTADSLVDVVEGVWNFNRGRFDDIHTLVLDLDNGPENHSRRTQFIKRMVDFVDRYQINVRLAYYPPYHSKYNPIERCWGILENYWNGTLLDSKEVVFGMAESMRWKGRHPIVSAASKVYNTGVRLTQKAMKELETRLHRLPGLEKWAVEIPYLPVHT